MAPAPTADDLGLAPEASVLVPVARKADTRNVDNYAFKLESRVGEHEYRLSFYDSDQDKRIREVKYFDLPKELRRHENTASSTPSAAMHKMDLGEAVKSQVRWLHPNEPILKKDVVWCRLDAFDRDDKLDSRYCEDLAHHPAIIKTSDFAAVRSEGAKRNNPFGRLPEEIRNEIFSYLLRVGSGPMPLPPHSEEPQGPHVMRASNGWVYVTMLKPAPLDRDEPYRVTLSHLQLSSRFFYEDIPTFNFDTHCLYFRAPYELSYFLSCINKSLIAGRSYQFKAVYLDIGRNGRELEKPEGWSQELFFEDMRDAKHYGRIDPKMRTKKDYQFGFSEGDWASAIEKLLTRHTVQTLVLQADPNFKQAWKHASVLYRLLDSFAGKKRVTREVLVRGPVGEYERKWGADIHKVAENMVKDPSEIEPKQPVKTVSKKRKAVDQSGGKNIKAIKG